MCIRDRDLLVAEVQENFLNLNTLAHLYRSFNLIEVKDIFVDVLEEYDYSIHESMFPMPVSYTHLDVYKRQLFPLISGAILKIL